MNKNLEAFETLKGKALVGLLYIALALVDLIDFF